MASSTKQGTTSTDTINYVNIVLMLVSAGLAFLWPFYLFLVAYAVLGPLHYLTEISWLHERHYFTNQKSDFLFLIVVGVGYGFGMLVKYPWPQVMPNLVVIAFLGAAVLVFTQDRVWRYALMLAGLAFVTFVPITFSMVIAGMLLLTVVHVYFFTGCFILFGAMKSSSRSGYLSFGVFVGVAAVLFLYRPLPSGGVADSFVISHYDTAFGDLNIWMLRVLGLSPKGAAASDPFEFSPGATAIMRFIAFAYLYHYLNWFSKTKIIRWHEVSKLRLSALVVVWVGAVAAYAIDYDAGLKLLFTLSALHVLLEFPLDIRTVVGLGTEFRKRTRSRAVELLSS